MNLQNHQFHPPSFISTHMQDEEDDLITSSSSSEQCQKISAQHQLFRGCIKSASYQQQEAEKQNQGDAHKTNRTHKSTKAMSQHNHSSPRSPSSLGSKDVVLKPFAWGDEPQIFDSLPRLKNVSPCSTFDSLDTYTTFNSSLSSTGNYSSRSLRLHASASDTMYASFGSMGLPSEYPLLKAVSSFNWMGLEDDDNDDFDAIFAANSQTSSSVDNSPDIVETKNGACSYDLNSSPRSTLTSPPTTPCSSSISAQSRRTKTHRRQRSSELGSTFSFKDMVIKSKRTRNRALCEKDFQEQILNDLFLDVTPHSFTY